MMKILKKQKLPELPLKVRLWPLVFDENNEGTKTSKFTCKSKSIAFGI